MRISRGGLIGLTTGARQFALLVIIGFALAVTEVSAQSARSIKIVVPFAAGGGADILARLLSEQISRTQGVTAVVENRPGAGTVIGTEAVARSAPDGNTLLIGGNSFVVNPNLRKVNYDPLTSFAPICHLTRSPNVIAVNSASPYRTLADLINAARANPGKLSMGFNGPATSQHIGFEMFKRVAKVDMTPVPFGGAAPAVNSLVGNHVTSLFVSYPAAGAQIQGGSLRALGVASRERIETLPDLPTVAEAGFGPLEEEVWFGLVAPAKTPTERLSQLESWFVAAVKAPEIKSKLAVQELYPAGLCGAAFAAYLREKLDAYGRIIRDAGIKAE